MAAPAQSYCILFTAYLNAVAATVPAGYAVTKSSDGVSYVVANTANLAASTSGAYDGVALVLGNASEVIQIQRDAKVDKDVIPWLGSGGIENAVVDANGKIWRASQASGSVIGIVDKEGGVQLRLDGAVPTIGDLTIAGDVTGSLAATTVVKIQNRSVLSTAPSTGNQLAWNGSAWAPAALSLAGGSGYVAGILPVANGGTGLSSPGTSGNLLVSTGVAWTSSSPSNLSIAGDVTGSLGSTTVVKIQNRAVSSSAPSTGDLLSWNGSAWAPTAGTSLAIAGDVTGTLAASTVVKIQNRDVSSSAPSSGNVLTWNGSAWAPAAPASVTWGTDLFGSTDTNQTVIAATGAGGAFLIRNTAPFVLWSDDTASPFLAQITRSTDAAAQTLTVAAQSAYASAVTNRTGGTLNLYAGTGAASNGTVYIGAADGSSYSEWVPSGSHRVFGLSPSIGIGGNAATGGEIRLPKQFQIQYRNNAGSANRTILATDSSDQAYFGDVGAAGLNAWVGGAIVIVSGTSDEHARFTTSGLTLNGTSRVYATGGTIATVGDFRTRNATQIVAARNAANGANLGVLLTDSSNNLFVGSHDSAGTSNVTTTYVCGNSGVNLLVGGTSQVIVSTSAIRLGLNSYIGTSAPNFQSAVNALILVTGTAPSSQPTGGPAFWGDGGRPSFWGSNSPGTGIAAKVIFQALRNNPGLGGIDVLLQCTIADPSGGSDIVRYLPFYVLAGG